MKAHPTTRLPDTHLFGDEKLVLVLPQLLVVRLQDVGDDLRPRLLVQRSAHDLARARLRTGVSAIFDWVLPCCGTVIFIILSFLYTGNA